MLLKCWWCWSPVCVGKTKNESLGDKHTLSHRLASHQRIRDTSSLCRVCFGLGYMLLAALYIHSGRRVFIEENVSWKQCFRTFQCALFFFLLEFNHYIGCQWTINFWRWHTRLCPWIPLCIPPLTYTKSVLRSTQFKQMATEWKQVLYEPGCICSGSLCKRSNSVTRKHTDATGTHTGPPSSL